MKVLAAMSGGVDSAVAAARVAEAGHDVTGIHLAPPANQVVAQRGHPGGVLRPTPHGQLHRGGQSDDRGGVDRAGADVALLPTPVLQRGDVQLASYDERADAERAAQLVPGQGERVGAGRGEVHLDLADGLHRVGVHGDPVGACQLDHLGDRLERPHLVVRPHHRHEGDRLRVAVDGLLECLDVEPALGVDRQQLDRRSVAFGQPVQGVEHRVVLHGGGEDAGAAGVVAPPRPEQALGREVVGLGAAGGEHDLARPAAQRTRDPLAGLLHDAPGVAPRGVQRGGVADPQQLLAHRRDGLREHRGRGGMVEVGAAACRSGVSHG